MILANFYFLQKADVQYKWGLLDSDTKLNSVLFVCCWN